MRSNLRRPNPQRRRPDAFDLGAEIEQQPRHHLDVADPRHVVQHALASVSRHAASNGSAAFLFPSTATRPSSR
jgi:hypothetical protein